MNGRKILRPLLSIFLVFVLGAGAVALTAPAQAQSPTQTQPQAFCENSYIVRAGDTLSEIADLCGTSTNALLRANPQIDNPTVIRPGEVIWLPGAVVPDADPLTSTYIIASGDTLSEVAVEYDTTIAALDRSNANIDDPALIYPGQRVTIPQQAAIPAPENPPAVTPTISILDVDAGQTVTVRARSFPALTQFDVLMGPIGTRAINGTLVETTVSDQDGFFTETYAIPASLDDHTRIAIRLESRATTHFAYNWFTNQALDDGESPITGGEPVDVRAWEIDFNEQVDVALGNTGLFLPDSGYNGMVQLSRYEPTNRTPLPEFNFTQQLVEVSFFDQAGQELTQQQGLNYLYFNLDHLSREAYDQDDLQIYHYDSEQGDWQACEAQVLVPGENEPHGRLSCILTDFGLYGIGEQ